MGKTLPSVLPRHPRTMRRGFTIIEMLVVIVVLTVLALIAIPIISSRVETARISKAQREAQALGDAQMRVESDLGYYVRLFMLNDTAGGDGNGFNRANPANDTVDGILDYLPPTAVTPSYYPSFDRLFIYANVEKVNPLNPFRNGALTTPTETASIMARIANQTDSLAWNGPYINWQVDDNFYDGGIVAPPGGEPGPDGVPTDPWGNNYLLFTPLGVIPDVDPNFAAAITVPGPVTSFSFPLNSSNSSLYGNLNEVTDRFAIVSMGPDGVPGSGPGTQFGSGDDIMYVFGRGASSVSP
jgi:prepilin-type N-terminal cleavage/methylation domain-containing protein